MDGLVSTYYRRKYIRVSIRLMFTTTSIFWPFLHFAVNYIAETLVSSWSAAFNCKHPGGPGGKIMVAAILRVLPSSATGIRRRLRKPTEGQVSRRHEMHLIIIIIVLL